MDETTKPIVCVCVCEILESLHKTNKQQRSVVVVVLSSHMCVITNALKDNLGPVCQYGDMLILISLPPHTRHKTRPKQCCQPHVHTHMHHREQQHDAALLIRLVILWGQGWHTSPALWQWFPSCVVMQLPPRCAPPPPLHTHQQQTVRLTSHRTDSLTLPSLLLHLPPQFFCPCLSAWLPRVFG